MIIFGKIATVKVLDVLVPIIAVLFSDYCDFDLYEFSALPGVFSRIFEEAFGIRQAVAGDWHGGDE